MDFKPAVKIAIGHQCDEKVSKISDDAGLKNIHAAKACDELDEKKLEKFKVPDCAQILHDMVHFIFGAACEAEVAGSAKESCSPFNGEDCKKAVDTAVENFTPSEIGESDAEQTAEEDGFEAVLGVVHHCSAAMTKVIASDGFQPHMEEACDDTDDEAMAKMGVGDNHCKKYIRHQVAELGTIGCVIAAFLRDDVPEKDDVTVEWMEKAAKEFREEAEKGYEQTVDNSLSELDSDTARLRLFQVMRQGKWPGQLRRWSPASVATASVVSATTAMALAALLVAAWRRRSARHPLSQDAEPILEQGLQSVE